MILTKLLFPSRCPFCSKVIEHNKRSCSDCQEYLNVPPHKQRLQNGCECLSAFRHIDIWRKAVLDYKFHSCKQYYAQLSLIIKDTLENNYDSKVFDFYTSVPMHKKKLKERGFDQVKLICNEAARLTDSESKTVLKQTRLNLTQHNLNKAERTANVRGIYECIKANEVKDKNILLFDDIITTGSTLLECSNVLLISGAKSVSCITLNCS